MKMTRCKKLTAFFLSACLVLRASFFSAGAAKVGTGELERQISQAIAARAAQDGIGDDILASDAVTNTENLGSSGAGSSFFDWLAFAIGRFSLTGNGGTVYMYGADGKEEYLSALSSFISGAYEENNGKLSSMKLTEWHRCLLAASSLGADAESFGTYCGRGINLVADSTFNSVIPITRQGINGVIYALIAMNSNDWTIPENAACTNGWMINYILKNQLTDGGWALNGSVSDADITAMALTALVPFYSDGVVYSFVSSVTGKQRQITVPQAVEAALGFLSSVQQPDGDVASWGTLNAESTSQVIIALTSLGIDIFSDSRFIKNDNTLYDGLMKYRLSDGAFSHTYSLSEGGKYNYMATDQAMCALVALWRYESGLNSLYNLRNDVSGSAQSCFKSIIAAMTDLLHAVLKRLAEFFTAQAFAQGVSSDEMTAENIRDRALKISEWYSSALGDTAVCAGSTVGDWYIIASSALGLDEDYSLYKTMLERNVSARYIESGALSAVKATEWHRIILAVLACSGNPLSFSCKADGSSINLVADGTYNRALTAELAKQGVNGLIWALIALDSYSFEVPEDSADDRESIIDAILSFQRADGGWALNSEQSDVDITAMALQALSVYYNDKPSVAAACESALSFLSLQQQPDGDFSSWGTDNCESTAQVITALCCLGLDPKTDAAFIKNTHSAIDGLMKYSMPDGGFAHSFLYDEDNPGAVPGTSDSIASQQAMCALGALYRLYENESSIYDFSDRCDLTCSEEFCEQDVAFIEALPDSVPCCLLTDIISVINKLENSADIPQRADYLQKLYAAKAEREATLREIEQLNSALASREYEAGDGFFSQLKAAEKLYERYNALGEGDRKNVSGVYELIIFRTMAQSRVRAAVIFVGLIFVAAAAVLFSVKNRKRRRAALKAEKALFADDGDDI